MAAATRDATPPPMISKAGRYTVFITPPAGSRTSSPSPRPQTLPCGLSLSPTSAPTAESPPPPVQVPPPQFDAPSNSVFGFFWDALAKIQDAHSRLDEYLAHLLGLNQSKYQWALNDYLESKPSDGDGKSKDTTAKGQTVYLARLQVPS